MLTNKVTFFSAQNNLILLEDESKTVEEIVLTEGSQILIEGVLFFLC